MEKRPTAEQLAKYKSNAKNESFSADVRAKFQSIVDKFENVGEAVVDAVEQKKERKPRTTKTTTKVVATKQTKSDIESAKAEIKKRTGKTEEECESIVEEYRSLRAKSQERKKKEVQATEDNKDRVSKLKKDDKIISGTNEKTADAVIESTTKDVSEKIVKEIDKIEQKAEVEAKKEVEKEMPKESATEKKKAVAEKVEEKVKEKTKTIVKRIVIDTSSLLTSIAESLGKFDKDSQKEFLIKLRSDIDKLLTKYSLGGSTMGATQTFNITQSNLSSSSVNPTMFGGGGGVDNKKRFLVDFYDSSDTNRDTSIEISIRENTLEDAIEEAIKKANEFQKNYIEFYYRKMFLGSINFALSKEFRQGKGYNDFVNNRFNNGGGVGYKKGDMVFIPSTNQKGEVVSVGSNRATILLAHSKERKVFDFNEIEKFNDGGGVGGNRAKSITHKINGKDRKFPIKDAWRREHNSYNESEKHEIPLNKRKFVDGGGVDSISYDKILGVLKDKLEDAVGELPTHFENSSNYKGEEVESISRDGFIPYTNGGYEVTWFDYLSYFYSSGYSLPTSALDKEKDRQIEYQMNYAKERFMDEYPQIVEELGEENIDYNSLENAGYGDEAEQLSEYESEFEDDSIMGEIGAYYYSPENDRGIDGKHTLRLFGLVNLESPYHRSGNLEDRYDIDITFNSILDLEKKVQKGLVEIIKWFDGANYKESNKELRIVRMAKGGMTEHALKVGDTIMGEDRIRKDEVIVIDSNKNTHYVNLDKGQRFNNGGGVGEHNRSYKIMYSDVDKDGNSIYVGRSDITAKSKMDAQIKFKKTKPLSIIDSVNELDKVVLMRSQLDKMSQQDLIDAMQNDKQNYQIYKMQLLKINPYAKGFADGGGVGKLKIGKDDFSFLLKLSDKELSKRLDLIRQQQVRNGKQYLDAKNKGNDISKIEQSAINLSNQENAIIQARLRMNKMTNGGGVDSMMRSRRGM
jgi:hypothetical protein